MTHARRGAIIAAAGTLTTLIAAAPASAEPPTAGGCAAFGQHVAGLATDLGAAFGATASSVATIGPRAFPTLVVHPEQERFCP